MTALQKRARALENNFAYEQEFMFRAQARRNKLIALWASAMMHRDDAQAYADELIAADIAAPEGAFARLHDDFNASGVVVLDDELRNRMSTMLKEVAADMYHGK